MLGFDMPVLVFIYVVNNAFYFLGKNMSKQTPCSNSFLIGYINKRTYCYLEARPYCKVGRKIISYAPVPHYNDDLDKFVAGGDVDTWVNELPVGACVYMITTVQEEKYSTEKFEKIELDKFYYSIKRTKMARSFDEYLGI